MKAFWKSRTLWGIAIATIGALVPDLIPQSIQDCAQKGVGGGDIAVAAGSLLAVWGRFKAETKLGGKG